MGEREDVDKKSLEGAPLSPEDNSIMKFAGIIKDDTAPKDLSAEFDHYMYGTPRKNSPAPEPVRERSRSRSYAQNAAALLLVVLMPTLSALAVIVALSDWLAGPLGERPAAAADVAIAALNVLGTHVLKRRLGSLSSWPATLSSWPGSLAQRTAWALPTGSLEGVLVAVSGMKLPIAFGLEPHVRWGWAIFAAGLLVWLVVRPAGIKEMLAPMYEEPPKRRPGGEEASPRENGSEE